jgi:hypothetical protein
MERGLIWLPLLALFVWLSWSGWREYQKLEAYKTWAEQFDTAKYDLYAVIGKKGDRLCWGKPTISGPVELQSISLREVEKIELLIDRQPVSTEQLPPKGKVAIALNLANSQVEIPFTEIDLAAKWYNYLRQEWQKYS